MAKYTVYETRTEIIGYEIEAASTDEALDIYLEGEEVFSKHLLDSNYEVKLGGHDD